MLAIWSLVPLSFQTPAWTSGIWAVILEPRHRKSVTASAFSPSICQEVMGLGAMILIILIFSFKPRQCVKNQGHHFADKGPNSQGHGLSSNHVQLWELDLKEGRALNNWCFWTVMLEKTLESLLDCREIKPVDLKGNQPWILIGRTDTEAEAPILWLPDANSWIIGKDPDAGKDWEQAEKRATEDEMAGWHHWCNGHELGKTPGDGEWQGRLACCSPWGLQELDLTWRLKNNNFQVNVQMPQRWHEFKVLHHRKPPQFHLLHAPLGSPCPSNIVHLYLWSVPCAPLSSSFISYHPTFLPQLSYQLLCCSACLSLIPHLIRFT